MNPEMQSQHRAFITLPHTWKLTPGKAPESSSRLPPVSCYTPCSSSSPLSPMYLPSLLPRILHGLHSFFVLVLVALCLLPCPAQAAWFRVGVVGPWGCDPLFAKALPSVAAQLAINRINRDPSLSYAATFNYAVLQVHHWSQLIYLHGNNVN